MTDPKNTPFDMAEDYTQQYNLTNEFHFTITLTKALPLGGHGLFHALHSNPNCKVQCVTLVAEQDKPVNIMFVRQLILNFKLRGELNGFPPCIYIQGADLLIHLLNNKPICDDLVAHLASFLMWKIPLLSDEDSQRLVDWECLWLTGSELDNKEALALVKAVAKRVIQLVVWDLEGEPVAGFSLQLSLRAVADAIEQGILPFKVFATVSPSRELLPNPTAIIKAECLEVLRPLLAQEWEKTDEEMEVLVKTNQRTLIASKYQSIVDPSKQVCYCRDREGGEKKEWLHQSSGRFLQASVYHARQWQDETEVERPLGEQLLPLQKLDDMVKLLTKRMKVWNEQVLREWMVSEGWGRLTDLGIVSGSARVSTPKASLRAQAKTLRTQLTKAKKTIKKQAQEKKQQEEELAVTKQQLFVSQESTKTLMQANDKLEKERAKKDEQHQAHTTKLAASVQKPLLDHIQSESAENRDFALKAITAATSANGFSSQPNAPEAFPVRDPAPVAVVIDPEPADTPSSDIPQNAIEKAKKKKVHLLRFEGGNKTKFKAKHYNGKEFDCGIHKGLPCGHCLHHTMLCGRCQDD